MVYFLLLIENDMSFVIFFYIINLRIVLLYVH